MAKLAVHELVRALLARIRMRPDASELRRIRDKIDTQSFRQELREYRRGLNDADTLNRFADDLTARRRFTEERRAQLDYDRQQSGVIGIGGGVALVGGGMVAVWPT